MKPMRHFRARVQKSGRIFYYFDAGGKPRKEIPLGSDYVLAVRQWSELMRPGTPAELPTFDDLAKRYEVEEIPFKAASTQATQKGDLKKLRSFFQDKDTKEHAPLEDITPSVIRRLLDEHKTTPTTANRLKRLFSHMFNKAREWDYTTKENPVTGVRGFELDKREVYITDEVFRLVRDAGSDPLKDAMDLAYLTGQRPSDVLQLTEHDIVDGLLAVKQGKTKAKRRIRVEGELAELIARIRARTLMATQIPPSMATSNSPT